MLETAWNRQLGLLFGSTAHASALILTSFFVGNGLGYLVGRQLLHRIWHPLKAYAVCEAIIASWSVLLMILFLNQNQIFSLFSDRFLSSPHSTQLLNQPLSHLFAGSSLVLIAIMLFLPATLAMGASLPFLAQLCKKWQEEHVPISIQFVYSVNTLGACLGVILASFISLHFLGLMGTQIFAAAIAGSCAVVALALVVIPSRRQGEHAKRVSGNTDKDYMHTDAHEGELVHVNPHDRPCHEMQTLAVPTSKLPWNTFILASFSGFAILVLEILYIRLFSLVFQNSVYSFGIVLCVFLFSLAAGSAVVARLEGRLPFNRDTSTQIQFNGDKGIIRSPRDQVISIVMQSAAAAILFSLLFFVMVTKLNYFVFGDNLVQYLFGALGLGLLILLPPIVIAGMLLPLLWEDAKLHPHHAKYVGTVACLNGLGAAAGAMVASFVLLPFLGLWNSFVLIALAYLLMPFLKLDPARWPRNIFLHACILLLCIATAFFINRYKGLGIDQTLLARYHSAYGWIDVVDLGESHSLEMRQNIHYGLGSSGATTMEKNQTHIPLLLHAKPTSTLFLGLATGITAGAALEHPSVEQVHVVELIPEVIKASRFFSKYNNALHTDERVSIISNDARTYVKHTAERYDVIIGDLFVPWESGTSYLYTVENFQNIRSRLNPGGLFCQWLPLWQLGPEELEVISNTFAHVFPHVSMWFAKLDPTWTAIGLVGSLEELTLHQTRLEERWKSLGSKNSLSSFLSQYAGDWHPTTTKVLNTDDQPHIEFTAPVAAWSHNGRLWGQPLVDFYTQTIEGLSLKEVQWANVTSEPSATSAFSSATLPLTDHQRAELRANQKEQLKVNSDKL